MTPVILLVGESGSGKDTLGAYLAREGSGCTVALADPIKRMARGMFGFSEEALWGPSEKRNEVKTDVSTHGILESLQAQIWAQLRGRFTFRHGDEHNGITIDWVQSVISKINSDGGVSARWVLQTLGTEWGRAIDPRVWSRQAVETAISLLGSSGDLAYRRETGIVEVAEPAPNMVVITDGRFRNEIMEVKTAGGIVVNVQRTDNALTSQVEAAGVPGHSSEQQIRGLPAWYFDYLINNCGSLDELHDKAARLLFEIRQPGRRM